VVGRNFGFQHLWHRFEFKVDADSMTGAELAALADRRHSFDAEVQIEFAVSQRHDESFDVSDGPDVFAAGAARTAVLDLIVQRVARRALELASRKGWLCFRGIVTREGGRSALCVSASFDETAPAPLVLAKDGLIMQVPRLHPIRPGSSVTPCGPGGVVSWEEVDALIRMAPADEARIEPISSLEAAQGLLAHGIELTETPGDRTRGAAALVRSAPGYAVWTPTWPELPASVWDCLGSSPSER
jgi:hypothetical protein